MADRVFDATCWTKHTGIYHPSIWDFNNVAMAFSLSLALFFEWIVETFLIDAPWN